MNVHRYQVQIDREGEYNFDAGDWLSALQLALALVEREEVVERLEVEVRRDGAVVCTDPAEDRKYVVRAMTYQGRPVEEFTLPPSRSTVLEPEASLNEPPLAPPAWYQPALAGFFALLLTLALMALVV